MSQELETYYLIPAIRRKIVKKLKKYGLTQQEIAKKMKLTNDELLIIMGLVAINSKISEKFLSVFSSYDKTKYTLDITISETLVNELVRICNLHKNQKGTVEKVINKIMMTKELISADSEYDKKLNSINEKYKSKIISLS